MTNLSQAVKFSIEIHDLRTELDAIPSKVREIEQEFKLLESQCFTSKEAHDQVKEQKQQLETAFSEETDRLQNRETRLNAIKTQKEYQAVVREISLAKTNNRERETKISQLSSELETYSKDLLPLEEKLSTLKNQLSKEKANIQSTLDGLDGKIKGLETNLEEQLSALPDDIREKYQRIQGRMQPPAAMVIEGTCQACFMALPPQLFNEIKKGHIVHSCPNCYRLLYLDAE